MRYSGKEGSRLCPSIPGPCEEEKAELRCPAMALLGIQLFCYPLIMEMKEDMQLPEDLTVPLGRHRFIRSDPISMY